MKCQAFFVTTPTADTVGTSLILHFDNQRYLVGNVHEGVQRAAIQRGVRLAKVTDILLAGKVEWKNTGGIMGMVLTLADVRETSASDKWENKTKSEEASPSEQEKPKLTIHGGENIMYTLATGRRFIFRKGLPIEVNEFTDTRVLPQAGKPTWSDKNIQVWAMPVEPQSIDENLVDMDLEEDRTQSNAMPSNTSSSLPQPVVSNGEQSEDKGKVNAQKLQSVISDMFDSNWRMDALFEARLSQVNLPASIFVRDEETKQIEPYKGPLPGSGDDFEDIAVLVRRPWPGALVHELPDTSPSSASMSYIIKNHPQRGKFDVKKAKALNVELGPDCTALIQGNSVLSKDGKEVFPEQVMGKGKPGGGFVFVDIPSLDYVPGLISRFEWQNAAIMEGVEVVIWNLGTGVAYDERLQAFISEHPHLKHVISSPDHCSNYLSMDSSSLVTIRHSQIDPARFDIPIHNNVAQDLPTGLSHCFLACRGMSIQLEPQVKVDPSVAVLPLNTADVLANTSQDVLKLARLAKEEISSTEVQDELSQQDLPSPEAEIVTLGTGSALPSKYRNVSSTLLRVPGSGSYLLDCGENTLGQLSRVYSQSELLDMLRDLKLIWISHMHGDHHLGLTAVIKAWHKAVYGEGVPHYASLEKPSTRSQSPAKHFTEQQRLFIASEPDMIHWLREYALVEDYGIDKLVLLEVTAVPRGRSDGTQLSWNGTPVGFTAYSSRVGQAMRQAIGLSDFVAANVPHCRGSKGVSLTFPTGFKFSYSGDCRPSNAFKEIGKGSTVLLHEATFDDMLRSDARAKAHSTTSEAIGVGVAMGARRVILTHFSQRYQKIPVMDDIENQEIELEEPSVAQEQDLIPGLGGADLSQEVGNEPEKRFDKTEKPASDVEQHMVHGNLVLQTPPETTRVTPGEAICDMKVAVAYDYMRVKVKDIMLLEKFTPAFQKLHESQNIREDRPETPTSLSEEQNVGRAHKKVSKTKLKEKNEREGPSNRAIGDAAESSSSRMAKSMGGLASQPQNQIIDMDTTTRARPNVALEKAQVRSMDREHTFAADDAGKSSGEKGDGDTLAEGESRRTKRRKRRASREAEKAELA